MSSGISEEEFTRFQLQLIELREQKYKSEEGKAKAEHKVTDLTTRNARLERDLKSANETIMRSRSARDVEGLVRENEALRDRLSGLEANFLLQNETLQLECRNLLSENERLQCQLETYKSVSQSLREGGDGAPSSSGGASEAPSDSGRERTLQLEVTKLCEEKAVLEEKLNSAKAEMSSLSVDKDELSARVTELLEEATSQKKDLSVFQLTLKKLDQDHETLVTTLHSKHDQEVAEIKSNHEKEICAMQEKHTAVIDAMEQTKVVEISKLTESFEKEKVDVEAKHVAVVEALEAEKEALIVDHEKALEDREGQSALDLEATRETLSGRLSEEQRQREVERAEAAERESKMKAETGKLEEKVQFLEEEIRSVKRKQTRQLKDMRRQLEKEVRRGEEMAAQLAECGSGYRSDLGLVNPNGVSSTGARTDDASSIYSLSNSGLGLDSPSTPVVAEADFKDVIDRLTGVQSENCDLKRRLSQLEDTVRLHEESLRRKDELIARYIGSRRASAPPIQPQPPTSPQKGAPLGRVVEMLRSRTSRAGENPEVRQLQHVLEEMMTRNLSLEQDLQATLDQNTALKTELGKMGQEGGLWEAVNKFGAEDGTAHV